jgi:hypothetical protein
MLEETPALVSLRESDHTEMAGVGGTEAGQNFRGTKHKKKNPTIAPIISLLFHDMHHIAAKSYSTAAASKCLL